MQRTSPRRWPVVLATLALAALAMVPLGSTAAPTADAASLPGDPAAMLVTTAEQGLLDLTNADRAQNGLAPLAFDPDTLDIARARAADSLGAPALTHYDADGHLVFARLLSQAGLEYVLAGENLARAASADGVAEQVEQALMNSPTHRKNILEASFNEVAIGAASDGRGRIAFAEIFRATP